MSMSRGLAPDAEPQSVEIDCPGNSLLEQCPDASNDVGNRVDPCCNFERASRNCRQASRTANSHGDRVGHSLNLSPVHLLGTLVKASTSELQICSKKRPSTVRFVVRLLDLELDVQGYLAAGIAQSCVEIASTPAR